MALIEFGPDVLCIAGIVDVKIFPGLPENVSLPDECFQPRKVKCLWKQGGENTIANLPC